MSTPLRTGTAIRDRRLQCARWRNCVRRLSAQLSLHLLTPIRFALLASRRCLYTGDGRLFSMHLAIRSDCSEGWGRRGSWQWDVEESLSNAGQEHGQASGVIRAASLEGEILNHAITLICRQHNINKMDCLLRFRLLQCRKMPIDKDKARVPPPRLLSTTPCRTPLLLHL